MMSQKTYSPAAPTGFEPNEVSEFVGGAARMYGAATNDDTDTPLT